MPPSEPGVTKLGSTLYQAFVEFPLSALTIARQQDKKSAAGMREKHHRNQASRYELSPALCAECQSQGNVSELLAEDPTLSPGQAWKKLYGHYKPAGHAANKDIRGIGRGKLMDEELEKTRMCGNWGKTEPSLLFLRLYHDALVTLNDDPSKGVVSPGLLGSSGVVPLTILSVIPDIMRHMSNLIVRAEKEVILATNFWQNSVASKYISDAIRELSDRAGKRGTKIVMKIIYDRGSARQLFEPHHIVPEKEFTGKNVGLPARHEIPHIDLQVMNYHDPLLGTFHSKFAVVDRKIAIVQSNNIQDNENMEMMVQLEGPIVDSFYDMALLSWHKKMDPPLPCLKTPATKSSPPSDHGHVFTPRGTIKGHEVVVHPDRIPVRAAAYGTDSAKPLNTNGHGRASPNNHVKFKGEDTCSQDLAEHTSESQHYDVDIAGEISRIQASISTKPGESRREAVTRHLNHTANEGFAGDAPECDPQNEMTPLIPHPAQDPFPIAMVNRAPHGPPNHKSLAHPQNAVWLSALRNAEKNVFIQSPTLNAEPLVPAIVEACERGIDVYCYICLGYNDAGELLPMQGGHNEMIAAHLHKELSPSARARLHYHWYVAKDQLRPIIAEEKKRSCHVKLMIVDERIGIVGSGNQDTQSWFHSQEVNVMLESADVCRVWADALRRNQNTAQYGAVGAEDGVWRDADGKQAEGVMGVDPGRFSWCWGLLGAVERVRGVGGF